MDAPSDRAHPKRKPEKIEKFKLLINNNLNECSRGK